MTPDELLDLARRLVVPVTPDEAPLLAVSLARTREALASLRGRVSEVTLSGPRVPGPAGAAPGSRP